MTSFRTISEELTLGTDTQTLLRTFNFIREETTDHPREEVFALIELAEKPVGGEELIRAIFATVKEVCFLDQTQDSFERFETALKEINAVIADARETLPNKHIGRINAVVGLLSGNDLHLTQAGEAEGYLIRRGTITTITEGLTPDEAVDIFVNIASGTVENHDKIVLASERLLRYATKTELTKIFSPNKDIGLALEELDEIIVLEGAQTTGVFAFDISASIGNAPNSANAPLFGGAMDKLNLKLPTEGVVGDVTKHVGKHVSRGISWVRDQIPANAQIPGGRPMQIDKNYVILGFLIVLIFTILTVTWNISNKASGAKLAEAKEKLNTVQTQLDMAIRDRNIGNKGGAYDSLKTAETTINTLIGAGVAVEEAQLKLAQIATLRDELDNIRRQKNLKPVADLAKSVPEISLVGLDDFHGRKITYDAHQLIDVTLDQVGKPVMLDSKNIIRAGRYFADRDAMLFTTSDGKMIEWRDGAPTAMKTEDPAWKTGVDVATYSSFIYLLDPTNNQIWKYTRKRDGYGKATGYSQNADLTKAISLAIDGDLWVLVADADGNPKNDILRIRKGEKRVLTIKDLPTTPWTNPTKIFTNENLKFLYVVDRVGRKVLRFYKDPPDANAENKQLVYNTQYFFEDLKDIRDVWVDSAEQKLYVIDGTKLYSIGL